MDNFIIAFSGGMMGSILVLSITWNYWMWLHKKYKVAAVGFKQSLSITQMREEILTLKLQVGALQAQIYKENI